MNNTNNANNTNNIHKPASNKTAVKGIIFTLIGGISWGFCGTCGEYLFKYKGYDSKPLSCIRLIFAGLILILISLFKNKKAAFSIFKNKKDTITLAVFGIFGLLVSQFTYLTAISYSNSGTATVLQYVGLVLIMIVVCIKELRLPHLNEFLAFLCAIGGIFLVATGGDPSSMIISRKCLFWGLSAAVGLMLYSVIPVGILKKYDAITVSGFGMLIGGTILSLIIRPWEYQFYIDTQTVLCLIGVIFVGTVAAYSLYLFGVTCIGPVKAGMIAAIEPAAAAVFSALWIGTDFTAVDLIGFVLIISTVFIINIHKR